MSKILILTIIMKTIKLFSLAAIAVLCLACGQSPDTISQSTIKKEADRTLIDFYDNRAEMLVGVYECNDEDTRLKLRKLEVAGLIEYDVTRYAWWEKENKSVKQTYKVTRYNYWYGSYEDTETRWVKKDFYTFEDHYIVKVNLTKKGKSYVVDSIPEDLDDKDLVGPDMGSITYKWDEVDLSENWPKIANPFVDPEEESVQEDEEPAPKNRKMVSSSNSDDDNDNDGNVERINETEYYKYKALEESTEVVMVEIGKLSASKARNILIGEKEGFKVATAEVIFKWTDVNDFGRILEGLENGIKLSKNINLIYFIDKGWKADWQTIALD